MKTSSMVFLIFWVCTAALAQHEEQVKIVKQPLKTTYTFKGSGALSGKEVQRIVSNKHIDLGEDIRNARAMQGVGFVFGLAGGVMSAILSDAISQPRANPSSGRSLA